jgi:uncharacterized phage protein (TIGR01671 family)
MKNTREIKFRAWDKKNKQMLGISEIGNLMFSYGENYDHITKYEAEIMQFTGLKDMKGAEIYEGDIVKWSDGDYKHPSNPRIAEVRFDPELSFFAFNVDRGGHKFGFSNFIYTDTERHLEIIGNIYENPELLP